VRSKRFQASGMGSIDFPHKFNPRKSFSGRKSKKFSIFASIHTLQFPDSGSGMHFQALEMRVIDSSHKISPNRVIFEKISGWKIMKKSPKFRFVLIHPVIENFKNWTILIQKRSRGCGDGSRGTRNGMLGTNAKVVKIFAVIFLNRASFHVNKQFLQMRT
jgi:hypothetical protein